MSATSPASDREKRGRREIVDEEKEVGERRNTKQKP